MISSAPGKLTRNESLKSNNPLLAGTIAKTLADPAAERFSDDDYEFLKFHGIYQQDDRDKRKFGKQYMYMIRGRLPGGVVVPDQYLAFDRLSELYGNDTLRITTRQGFQFHGVVKSGLGKLMKGINDALGTTLAACGDVNRNVTAAPTPATSILVERVLEDAKRMSKALLPKTRAYHEIWVEGKELSLAPEDQADYIDPLYGKSYLPRKFKTAFAIPPLNDIDIFTNDSGFIAIADGDRLAGYNLVAGGGMGMSHGNAQTFPRLANLIGFLPPEAVETVGKAVLTIHRDFGDRTNRKHARLKYVLEERGVDWFRQELEQRAGLKLEPARPFHFDRQGDLYGWHRQFNGKFFLGIYVEMGRIKDGPEWKLKSALRKIVEQFRPEVRLTPNQNLLLVDVAPEHRDGISAILAGHGISVDQQGTVIRRAALACPALPTCGLALAESERLLPGLLTQIESLLAEIGLRDDEITIRMTGCPNGCARPYLAEIGLVGKAPNKYQLYLGGNLGCTRLNRLYKDNVKTEELLGELRPILTRYKLEKEAGERFGDFCERVLRKEPVAPAAAQ